MAKTKPGLTPHPLLDAKLALAEQEAYRVVLQESGFLASLIEHPASQRLSIPELLAVMPLDFEAMTKDQRKQWENSLWAAGSKIPYHPAWYAAYPKQVAEYPYKQLLKLITRDVEYYEQRHPYLFSGTAGGYDLILVTLKTAKNPALQHRLQQARAYQQEQLARLEWLTARPINEDEEQPATPNPMLLYLNEPLPGLKKPPVIEWAAHKVDWAELAYSLLESGAVRPVGKATRTDALKALAEMFGLPVERPAKHQQTIKKRTPGPSLTPFLDRLSKAFRSFLGDTDKES